MKNLYLTILLIHMLVLGGCVTLDEDGCPVVPVTVKAKDDGKSGNGRDASFINIRPDTRNIRQNCPLTIKNPNGHLIHTTSSTPWLNRPSQTEGDITTGKAIGSDGDIFKYTIHVDGIGQLDPRVRVTN